MGGLDRGSQDQGTRNPNPKPLKRLISLGSLCGSEEVTLFMDDPPGLTIKRSTKEEAPILGEQPEMHTKQLETIYN